MVIAMAVENVYYLVLECKFMLVVTFFPSRIINILRLDSASNNDRVTHTNT